jgi:hypothetical protein
MRNHLFTIYCFPTMLIFPFLLNAEDSITCFPPCRTGYICHNDSCISICNPPCPNGQKCTNEGECVEVEHSLMEPIRQTRSIACDKTFIVRPDINSSIVPGNYSDGELLNVSILVANSIASKVVSSYSIISSDEVGSVNGCKSKLIVCKIKSYFKEPAQMGQYEGIITIIVETYNSINDRSPVRIEEFSARGERHWGDSVPLENAFKAVSDKIKRNIKQ